MMKLENPMNVMTLLQKQLVIPFGIGKFKKMILFGIKEFKDVFGYKKEDVGKTSKWWFDRIHPEDSIKMSIKLYSFIEQKTEKWQDEYRFKCADGTYKYVFDRGFLVKDENGNASE
jgi:PAS domain-containing protein